MRRLIVLFWCSLITAQTPREAGKPDTYVEGKFEGKFSCLNGPSKCPDGGRYGSAGGNITLTVLEMRNLPDLDSFGAAGLETDAYIKATMISDGNVRISGVIPNSLNPIWPPCVEKHCLGDKDIMRDLNFGYRRAGQEIIIEIYDNDNGLEFGDDLIGTIRTNVIYCSAFTAKVQKTPNEEEDSIWKMPEQPMCVEEAWQPMLRGRDCFDKDTGLPTDAPCIKLRQTVIPFQLRVEDVFVEETLVNGGMGGFYEDESLPWVYGRVYSDSPGDRLIANPKWIESKGGLLVRSGSTTNNEKGNQTLISTYGFAPYARFTCNYDADMYVFRRESDMPSVPEWLTAEYGWEPSSDRAALQQGETQVLTEFLSVKKTISRDFVNRYGDSLGAGEITGMNIRQDNFDFTAQMYFIILVPHESHDALPPQYSKEFDVVKFLYSFLYFGVVFCFLLRLSFVYLRQMRWRTTRIYPYLLTFAVDVDKDGDDPVKKSVLKTLFVCYNDSERNQEFRRNLFYSKMAILVCLSLPFLILFSWGLSIVTTVVPPTVGITLIFIGIPAICLAFALIRWKSMGWRMTSLSLTLILGSFFGCFIYLLAVTFVDPKVYVGGANVDFFSLSSTFLTLNMMPMIYLAFTNDSKIMKSLKQVLAVVTASQKVNILKKKFNRLGALGLKLGMAKGNVQRERGEKPQSAFHSLVGDHYSVVSSIKGFQLADILQNAFVLPDDKRKKANRRCYIAAIMILVVYAIMSYYATDYPTQGIGILFTVIVLDISMAMLLRGNVSWSAGYIVLIMGLCRGCLVICGGKYWLLGQSMLFMIFGIALCKEIVGKNLPRMSKQEAGGITFFGHEIDRSPHYDISTTPEFVLGFISFFFIFLLLAVVFGTEDPRDFVLLPFFGQEWAMWVFGLLAFLLVLFYGISVGTSRAFFLMKEQLLSDYASNAFLFHKAMKLPFILAAAAELLVICSGLFLFASTGSTFIFILSVFGPVIMMVLLLVYAQWRKNDFQLIIWPPPEDEEFEEEDDEFNEEEEYEKEAEAIRENFVLPPLKTGGGEDDDEQESSKPFKMPSLPLKGALLKAKPIGNPFAKPAKSILELAGAKKEEGEEKKTPEEGEAEADTVKPEAETKSEPESAPVAEKNKNPTKLQAKMNKFSSKLSELNQKAPWAKYIVKDKKPEAVDLEAGGGEAGEEVDFNQMSVIQAFRDGYLLQEDYMTIGCLVLLLTLVFIFGLIVSATEEPAWLGNMIWLGFSVLFFTFAPVYKWFHVLELTQDMKYSLAFSAVLSWSGGFVIFFQLLQADVNSVYSLVVLSFLVLFPVAIVFVVGLLKWKDDDWEITDFTRVSLPLGIVFAILWIFEMFAWVGPAFGGILTFIFFTGITLLFFLVKWIENESYVAPKHQKFANYLLIISVAFFFMLGVFGGEIFYGFSIGLIIIMIRYSSNIVGARMTREPEVQVFYSPYIFPIYSYDAKTSKLVDENYETFNLYKLFTVAFFWGVIAVMFADPLGFGVGLCSLVLFTVAATSSHLCSMTPVKMGVAAKYVNEKMLKDAAIVAKEGFVKRREKLHLICQDYVEKERKEREAEIEFQKLSLGKVTTLNIFSDDEETPEAERRCAADVALAIDDSIWKCKYTLVDGQDTRREDSFYTVKDALMELWCSGGGPFGYVSLFGAFHKLYLRSGRTLSTENYTEKGYFKATSEVPLVDSMKYMKELPKLDEELDHEFYEETRCIIHFQLLVMDASDARLGRETVLFQKFLRENRFKLMSNGINPPSNIFKTSSFASIDIQLVAVWLISLTPEERERFHNLKTAFSDEMDRKDAMVDNEDEQNRLAQEETIEYLKHREDVMCRRRFQEFQARRQRRQEDEIDIGDKDEGIVNAEESITEIESGWSCNPGQYGRSLQFVDPDFPPDQSSIAGCANESEIVEWKVSTGININAGLFDGGTDPDDVHIGKLHDSWFLSAISIVAASGGVDDGKVDELIDNLFVTKQTSLTGAYAMRFYKNSQWETVIVDDYFPILDDSYKTEDCAGAAFAHSKNFEELWVPLLEKAYAKYHGGYAVLEHGYVHHALKDLTGAESEQLFLAQASRGARKKKLWKQLLEYKKNHFLMGAGTITSETADHEILDTGLVFGACYVIYDIQSIHGHHLIKLRNPPGDHAEWRGDWGDESPLWTRQLKKKLGWTAEDDNTFWMSFDDFCNAFRCLFVCRYYDPERWMSISFHGAWDNVAEAAGGLPTKHNPDCIVENNAQYVLHVLRPSDVVITVTQVDPSGLATPIIHPFGIYVVQSTKADRATRVKYLDKDNVVACSSEPVCKRQIEVYCTLKARSYTILVAPYVSGLEGPFKLEVKSNFRVELQQLWPAPWREPKEPTTVAEKMAAKMKEKVAESGAMEKFNQKKALYKNKIAAGAKALDNVTKDDADLLKEQIEEEEKGTEKKKSPWIERWDENSGKPYYYNKKTGISAWEKPPDFE